MTLKLRQYQLDAISAVHCEWTKHRSTLLVLPTGAGKTVIFTQIANQRPGRTLVIAHRDELIDQAAQKFRDIGVPVEIEKASSKASRMSISSVVVGSVQTLTGNRLLSWAPNSFNTIIIDEAHRATAKSYLKIINHFAGASVLGVTATPDRADKIAMGNVFDSTAMSLDIEDLIELGFLVDIEAKTIEIEDFDISACKCAAGKTGDFTKEGLAQINRAMTDEKMLYAISGPIIEEARIHSSNPKSTLIFTSGVEASKALKTILSGHVDANRIMHIDGKTDPMERRKLVDAFKRRDILIATNFGVFTEGFDAPNVEVVAICRPTKSRALFAQMIGRGTRPDPTNPGKKSMTVLNFVPGVTGNHRLITPIDVLGGKMLGTASKAVREKAEELLKSGMRLRDAMTEAERLIAEQIAEEERIERLEKKRREELEAARKQEVRVNAAYYARDYGLWGNNTAGAPIVAASKEQLDFLASVGVKTPYTATAQWARAEIGRFLDRKKRGLCSPKQERVLIRAGLRGDVSRREASEIIGVLEANRWRPTPEILAKYKGR